MKYHKIMIAAVAVFLFLSIAAGAYAGLSVNEIEVLGKQLAAKGATFTVGPSPATERDLKELCGLVPPKNWWIGAPFSDMRRKRALPSSWNWCDQGKCPDIRDQLSCNSCWAFSTTALLEINIMIIHGAERDLSEQYLVSCNTDGWDCIRGGWWAHDYHQWKYRLPETEAGAVPEDEFPYAGWDKLCGGPYSHPFKIDAWGFIGSSFTIPSVDSIKQAIIDYGPVGTAIYSGPAFHAYTGGIFNIDESGDVNHGVVIVGWDDNQGKDGVWILRNSWGKDWGEGGYMRIEYGLSRIGYSANFIEYSPGLSADFEGSPVIGEAPLTVKFTDKSTGDITEWFWEFGDSLTSTQRNPVHTYNNPEDYTVTLTVTGPDGWKKKSRDEYIRVAPQSDDSLEWLLLLLEGY
ncbi:MAG: PKD domain-containing protein [Deltaproteobacteria bacterium]|nr:PKD domain-containing protein [Deltaproteobacteria bacterium]